MTGVIWIIQLIHYPAFIYIDHTRWTDFHRLHTRGITPLVAPLMLIELALSIVWVYQDITPFSLTNLAFVLGLWLSTFIIQVPIHDQLVSIKDEKLIQKLIKTNWIRTILWTAKTLLLLQGLTLN
jgi:hypothetical protein